MLSLAAVVVFVTLLAPFGKLIGTLYVLLRLHETPATAPSSRVRHRQRLRPWSMIEVFVFGVFVAYVKLGDLVHITLDTGVYALLALTVAMIRADSALDREAVWQRLHWRSPDDCPHYRGSSSSAPCGRLRGLRSGQHSKAGRAGMSTVRHSPPHAQA